MSTLDSFPPGGVAVIIGATGGIGRAVADAVRESGQFSDIILLSRQSDPAIDLLDETTIEAAFHHVASLGNDLRLIFDATGVLDDTLPQGGVMKPEKALRAIEKNAMAHSFAVNAIGPALLLKHAAKRLPRTGKSVFATLSAKVGSIGDNRLGGWISYRASKAALNQIVRTAAIEIARNRPEARVVALHPGTVDTGLSQAYARTGLDVLTPEESAKRLLTILDQLPIEQTGEFFSHTGDTLPW